MSGFETAGEPDWPEGPHRRELIELDRAAQCGICHDFFDTPLALPCGHSYCAECIRSNLQYQEREQGRAACPQCRQAADSRTCQPNHGLRELVTRFLAARPALLAAIAAQAVSPAPAAAGGKRKRAAAQQQQPRRRRKQQQQQEADAAAEVIALDSGSEPEPPARQLRARCKPVTYYPPQPRASDGESHSSGGSGGGSGGSGGEPAASRSGSSGGGGGSSSSSESEASSDGGSRLGRQGSGGRGRGRGKAKGGAQQQGKPPRGWVACPICSQTFPAPILNDHLDKCIAKNSGGSEAAKPGSSGQAAAAAANGHAAAARKQLAVPPKLLLSLEKDKQLRERLKRYGLSTKGSRKELELRYDRFRVEVQTACDRGEAGGGCTYASLARRIAAREASAGAAAAPGRIGSLARGSAPAAGTSAGFDDLIRATRQRASASAPAAQPRQPQEPGEPTAAASPAPGQDAAAQQQQPQARSRRFSNGPPATGQQQQQQQAAAAEASSGEGEPPDGGRRQAMPWTDDASEPEPEDAPAIDLEVIEDSD